MNKNVLILVAMVLCNFCYGKNRIDVPTAKEGVLDLRSWQARSDSRLEITGDWSFYWNRLLTPAELNTTPPPPSEGFVDIRQEWKSIVRNGKRLPGTGCATYRLVILLTSANTPLTLQAGRIMTSFRLWINDSLSAEAGIPATSRASSVAQVKPQMVTFSSNRDSLTITLQIANHEFDNGGVTGLEKFGSISIGSTDTIFSQHEKQTQSEAFFVGAFIVMAMFHFAMFFFSKNDTSLIYLGIICILMLLYIIREHLLMQFLPGLSWGGYRIIYNIPVYMLAGFFLLFFNTLYPNEANKQLVKVLTIGSVFFTGLVLFIPPQYTFSIFYGFVPYMFTLIVVMICIIIRAAFNNRTSAKYILYGSWSVALAAVNDVGNDFGLINTGLWLPVGGFFFILMCEFGIYERFVQAELTAKKQQAQLVESEKLASLGTLVAGIAHEINNPNNSILLSAQGHVDIWKQVSPIIDEYCEDNEFFRIGCMHWKQLKKEMPESFERVVNNSHRIERIVADLKTFAREDIKKIMEPCDINLVVKGSISLLQSKLKHSTDFLSIVYEDPILLINGNFQKLEQVVINLLVNACEALPDRSRAIRIATSGDQLLRQVKIVISDEGSGIPATMLRQIFNPFFTTKNDSGGTGLGLSIAKSIIASHNGDLSIESTIGAGTIATIIIPAMEVAVDG